MGIKDLWTILSPYCDKKPLFELQGKTVAVDLSCWICEAQNITDYQIQPRMYLRNLYFRTCYLLLMDVQPVFVLEGKAPTLKYQTIANRNEIQFKGSRPKSATSKINTGKDRTRFRSVLKQCEDMLKYMGLACVQGNGEAEAMCAYLNADGLVAGCISQDSDCFAYGAKVVYRNFSISQQGKFASTGGAVDIYDIEKINKTLNLGKNKMIVLALLCGSDYNEGVRGIGKDSAIKFMENFEDEQILDRIRSWRTDSSKFSEMEKTILDKNICSTCGHIGKLQSHSRIGCSYCKTSKGCNASTIREEKQRIKNELHIRSKALMDPDFPNECLVNEFLIKKDNVKELDLNWRQPDLINFVKFTTKFLAWEEIYAFEKLLPILTRWQVKNRCKNSKGCLNPLRIKKVRNPKGVPSYEILWEDKYKYYDRLIPVDQIHIYEEIKKDGLESLYTTVEPQNLVEATFPDLVEEYLASKKKPAKKPVKRQKKIKNNDGICELSEQLLNTSISEPKCKKTKKVAKTTKKEVKVTNTIEHYFPKTKVAQFKQIANNSFSYDLNVTFSDGEVDENDLSLIVNSIVSRSPKISDKIKKLGYEVVQNTETETKLNESCFFVNNLEEIDLFEQTFNKYSSDSDEKDELNETFDCKYIPLCERIRGNISP